MRTFLLLFSACAELKPALVCKHYGAGCDHRDCQPYEERPPPAAHRVYDARHRIACDEPECDSPFESSALAVAHAAKQGMVVMLKAMNAMSAAISCPCAMPESAEIMLMSPTSSSTPSSVPVPTYAPMQIASVVNVAMTFSLAMSPVIAATANTQPN